MTTRVKIIGAGSIGNHLANASQNAGWDVTIVDKDPEALRRTKEELYPKRYGAWDESITLCTPNKEPKGFDVVFIGTPPDVHLPLATRILKEEAPKVLQIEKPLCSPTLEGLDEFLEQVKKHPETKVIVGYNHLVAQNTVETDKLLASKPIGDIVSLDCAFQSSWLNILAAHPWLKGPEDTYLGFWKRGGGAGGEHSHGLNIWQHFAHTVGAGRVKRVFGQFDYIEEGGTDYDRTCYLLLETESGIIGRVAQDVVTQPKRKQVIIQGKSGSVEWYNDVTKTTDVVKLQAAGKDAVVQTLEKTRPEEFSREIDHIKLLLDGTLALEDSPMSLRRAVDTMAVLAAAHESFKKGAWVTVEYPY